MKKLLMALALLPLMASSETEIVDDVLAIVYVDKGDAKRIRGLLESSDPHYLYGGAEFSIIDRLNFIELEPPESVPFVPGESVSIDTALAADELDGVAELELWRNVWKDADTKGVVAGKLGSIKVSASGYANVGGMTAGAIIADFAPIVTVNGGKKVFSIHTNLWFDRSNGHGDGVGGRSLWIK